MTNQTNTKTKSNHNFGEKTWENSRSVYQTPSYLESRKKAIEMIDSGIYGLTDADFWIQKFYMKDGTVGYKTLIISHNGCLKVNSKLPEESKFYSRFLSEPQPSPFGNGIIMFYDDGELREYGEVNDKNCKQQYEYYPMAMLLKRVMDRVILKKSGLAYAGIYSEVEADSFAVENNVSEATAEPEINAETGEVIETQPKVETVDDAKEEPQMVEETIATEEKPVILATTEESVENKPVEEVKVEPKEETSANKKEVEKKEEIPTPAAQENKEVSKEEKVTEEHITMEQVNFIITLKNKLDITDELMGTRIKNITGKGRLRECSKSEASALISFLKGEVSKTNANYTA